jgi:tetratricopeptide (TPR) repeat protein
LTESEARRLVTARVREATGDRAGARDLLSREPLESNPALSRFLLGEWALLDGDGDAARSLLRSAAESDLLQMRASPLTNELVRRLAATLPFTLRDTARLVEEAGAFRIAGWESFEDNCHLRPAVRAREAQEILLSLPLHPPANDSTFPAAFASAWTSGPQIAGLLEGFSRIIGQSQPDYLLQWYLSIPGMVSHWLNAAPQQTREAIETFLKEKVETRLAPGASRDRFLIALAEGFWRARLPEEARRLGALTDHSDDARTWVERGLLWLHLGQHAEASAAFDKAVALNPASHELRLYAEVLKSHPAR